MSNIELKVVPVIAHDLVTVGTSVSQRISALNLEAQVVTEDTIQSLKKLKAELVKEFSDYETQRKAVKKAVTAPYDELDAVYKTEITAKYNWADDTLKAKINEFELKLKTDKKAKIQMFFVELCQVEKIDWLSFDRLGIEINLSTSEKKYKEQVQEFVFKVSDDIKFISTEEFASEMMVEYKKTLNASGAITAVRERKQAEKMEKERLKLAETNRRTSLLAKNGFIYHDLTRTYNWVQDETILVQLSEIENASPEMWIELFAGLESEVINRQQPTAADTPKVSAPLSAPIVQQPTPQPTPQTLDVSFKVYGTFEQLTALNNYLKQNGYKYEQLK